MKCCSRWTLLCERTKKTNDNPMRFNLNRRFGAFAIIGGTLAGGLSPQVEGAHRQQCIDSYNGRHKRCVHPIAWHRIGVLVGFIDSPGDRQLNAHRWIGGYIDATVWLDQCSVWRHTLIGCSYPCFSSFHRLFSAQQEWPDEWKADLLAQIDRLMS